MFKILNSNNKNFARELDKLLSRRKLKVNSEVLSEVTITEEKPIYESKIDKIVYNVENDSQGSDDAVDVLRKAPLLSVDLDGNVELRGSSNIKFLLNGITTTIYISVVSIVISMIIGFIVAVPSLAKSKFLTYLNIGYVEIVRAIPLLVLILWIYYGLPIMTGVSFSPFISGIIALSISESAFQAEIFRAGINSIKKAQWEAGSSLGLNFFRKLRLVILPQAIKNILPAIGNQFVYVLKMSSLVSIIGIGDLTRKANELVVTTYRPLEIYTFLILEYLILILIVSYFVRKLENKLKKD